MPGRCDANHAQIRRRHSALCHNTLATLHFGRACKKVMRPLFSRRWKGRVRTVGTDTYGSIYDNLVEADISRAVKRGYNAKVCRAIQCIGVNTSLAAKPPGLVQNASGSVNNAGKPRSQDRNAVTAVKRRRQPRAGLCGSSRQELMRTYVRGFAGEGYVYAVYRAAGVD